jgi:hypothetical protein
VTTEELRALDAEVCRFAGIPIMNENICPRCGGSYIPFGHCEGRFMPHYCQGGRGEWVPIYPSVSTSWEAAGRLMDALRIKCAKGGLPLAMKVYFGMGRVIVDGISAPDFPVALALAVAELAKVSKNS